MLSLYGVEIQFEFFKLSSSNGSLLEDFDCGNSAINEYFHKECREDSGSVTYLAVDRSSGKIVGVACLACSGILHVIGQYRNTIPAISIKYFAIKSDFHKMKHYPEEDHFYFSDQVLCDLIRICYNISENTIGAEYIILYAVPDAVKFYTRNGFKEFSEFMVPDNTRFLNECIPMYMRL